MEQRPITEQDLRLAAEYFKLVEQNGKKMDDFSKSLSSSTRTVVEATQIAKQNFQQTSASLKQTQENIIQNNENIYRLQTLSTKTQQEEENRVRQLKALYEKNSILKVQELQAQQSMAKAQTQYQRSMEAQYRLREKELSISEKIKSNWQAREKFNDASKQADALKSSGVITDEQYSSMINTAEKQRAQNTFNLGALGRVTNNIGNLVDTVEDFKESTEKYIEDIKKTGDKAVNLLSRISQATHNLNQTMVEGVVDIYSSMGRMEARLYGSDKSFASIISDIKTTVGVNSLVTQRDVLTSLEELVDNGITYNVEQRALLGSLSDSLVANFDVMSDSLTRLIRLQQQDNTQAYIGSESLLTNFLNTNFNDTSYLNGLYSSVYDAIIDGMSTLNADQASQFNYNVQKWLGALYSVGLSSSAVNMIAQAMNDIATGNLDSQSQTLLALAAQRSGVSYASYLTTGVTGDSVNKLLQSMVEYLQSIATNTDSNVVKKQFANLFGLTMSDWTAISNLSTTDIGTIANNTINLATATQETEKLLSETLLERIHSSTKINNLIENVKYSYGTGIANDETAYMEYVGSNLAMTIGDSLGSMMGKIVSVTENANQQKLLKIGLDSLSEALGADVGSSILSLLTGSDSVLGGIGNVISSVLEGSWSSLKGAFVGWDNVDWNGIGHLLTSNISPYLKANLLGTFAMNSQMRGGSIQTTETGTQESISFSAAIENLQSNTTATQDLAETIETSTQDAKNTTFAQEADKVSATAGNITSGEDVTSRSISDLYAALFENTNNPLRVGIAFYDDQAVSQLSQIFQSSDYFSQLNTMRA